MADSAPPPWLRTWLLACALLAFAVLVVGGITRLTHSGLSIVQWRPIEGVVPPMSAEDWSRLFDEYRATPEYRLVNPDMALSSFRAIFWWEYAHRLLARLAGLAFLLPSLFLLVRRALAPALAWRLSTIFLLGAMQGLVGWLMVASGLIDDPRVSPLRLAAHLGLGLLLIAALLWTAWSLRAPAVRLHRSSRTLRACLGAIFAMALTGALVAGTRAGFAFNTFPRMDGSLVPDGVLALDPWYRNFLENLATVQFTHRVMALVVTIMVLLAIRQLAFARRASRDSRRAGALLALALFLQLALGIATLLSVVALPLAAAHQAGSVLLWASALYAVQVQARGAP
jgi:heme a synthase